MPIISSRVAVSTSVTQLVDPVNGSVTDSISASVRNPGPTSVFLGGEFVTSAAGYELTAGGVIDVDLMAGDVLYGVTSAGSQELHIMRFRV